MATWSPVSLSHCVGEDCPTPGTLWHEAEIVSSCVQPLDCGVCCSAKPILPEACRAVLQGGHSGDGNVPLELCRTSWLLSRKDGESCSIPCCVHPWVPDSPSCYSFHFYAGFLVLSAVSILCMHPSNDSSSSCVIILVTTSLSFLFTDKPRRFALVLNVLGCLYFTNVLPHLSSQ